MKRGNCHKNETCQIDGGRSSSRCRPPVNAGGEEAGAETPDPLPGYRAVAEKHLENPTFPGQIEIVPMPLVVARRALKIAPERYRLWIKVV
jgi:hypothetical protein